MSQGYAQHQQRKDLLNRFAKDLVRRSKSACEICETRDVPLSVFEVPPLPDIPHPEQCVLICETCQTSYQKPRLMNPDQLKVLNRTIWSEIPAVQVLAVRLLRRLAKDQEAWAQDLLDHMDLDQETAEWSAEESP